MEPTKPLNLAEFSQRVADMQAQFMADSTLMDEMFRNRESLEALRELWQQQSSLRPITPRNVGPENNATRKPN